MLNGYKMLFLPPQTDIENIVPEHFIFYRPRDIVSGDFYWIKQIDELIIISAADCTGHGVPGALLSMLGISLLNEIVQHNNFTVPNMILNELRDNLMYSLRQSRVTCNAKNGMDLALCSINKKFLSKNFKKLLISIGDETMEKQNKILLQTFIEWKGNNEQVDDILIIGIKL